MDFSGFIIPLVTAACLVVGYVIKLWLPVDNKIIPTVCAVLGAVLGCVAAKDITLAAMVGGAVSGLASTGLHEAFRQWIEAAGKSSSYIPEPTEEDDEKTGAMIDGPEEG